MLSKVRAVWLVFVYLACNERVRAYFFFQAEDGIRDGTVTGVQTCALPIWSARLAGRPEPGTRWGRSATGSARLAGRQIGRASCRERVWIAVGGGSVKYNGMRTKEIKNGMSMQLRRQMSVLEAQSPGPVNGV